MATYHCQIKPARQALAVKHADYVECDGHYKKKREELEYKESGNMPDWAKDNPKEFWRASDELERKNATRYREIEVALPRELTKEQRIELARDFVAVELKNHTYTFAIHNTKASDGKEQPHAHIMFCERTLDGVEREREKYFSRPSTAYRDRKTGEMKPADPSKGGTKKADRWCGTSPQKARNVEKVRERWAAMTNRALERAGSPERVDHRSLADQGIDRLPEKHMGPVASKLENSGCLTRRRDINDSIMSLNESREITKQIAAANDQLREVNAELRSLQATRRQLWQGEQTRRAGMRSNRQIVHSIHQITYTLIPEPFATSIRVAADLLAAAGEINDWRDAKKYNDQMKLISAATAQSKAESDQNRLALLETKFKLINQKLDAEIDPLKTEKLLGQSEALYFKLEELKESAPVNPSPVSPLKPFVTATTAQSDSVTSLPEKVLSIQQPAFDSGVTAVERAYHAVLRQIAALDAKIRAYARNLDSGAINEERFNDLTDPLDKTLDKILAQYPKIKIEKCCYDVPATPIKINGQPITDIIETLPPEPKPEQKPAQTQGFKTGGRK